MHKLTLEGVSAIDKVGPLVSYLKLVDSWVVYCQIRMIRDTGWSVGWIYFKQDKYSNVNH